MNPGQVVGPYELVALLGQGGMGAVYRARHRAVGVERALKVLPRGGATSGRLSRFEREARNLARVQHPNVVRVHEAGQDGGAPYLVMELVPGKPLDALLEAGRPPLPRALALAADLARGVAALHEVGIVHRDLKPANVLVRDDGAPVVVDLGLAVAPDLDDRLTKTGAIMGTPRYMSPEQLQGGQAGPPSDVYSLGLIIFELVTGEAAVPETGSLPSLVVEVARNDRPAPSSVDPDLPAALDDLLGRVLARKADRRPTAAALIVELEALAAALADGTATTARDARARRRLIGGALAGGALALVGSLLAVNALLPPPPALAPTDAEPGRPARRAPSPRRAPADPEAARQLERAELLRDPAGRLEAALAWLERWPDHPARDRARAVVRAARAIVPLALQTPAGTVGAAFLDDRRVVSVGADGLRVWDADTGAELGRPDVTPGTGAVATLPGDTVVWADGSRVRRLALAAGVVTRTELDLGSEVLCLAAAPDGAAYLAGVRDRAAWLVPLDAPARRRELGGHGQFVGTVAFSPDGRRALTGTGLAMENMGTGDNSARLWDLTTGECLRRDVFESRVTTLAFVPGADEYMAGTSGARLYRVRLSSGEQQELIGEGIARETSTGILPTAHIGAIRGLAVAVDGKRAWTVSGGGIREQNELRAWDLEANRERYQVLARPASLFRLRLSPDGSRLLTCSGSGTVEVWSAE